MKNTSVIGKSLDESATGIAFGFRLDVFEAMRRAKLGHLFFDVGKVSSAERGDCAVLLATILNRPAPVPIPLAWILKFKNDLSFLFVCKRVGLNQLQILPIGDCSPNLVLVGPKPLGGVEKTLHFPGREAWLKKLAGGTLLPQRFAGPVKLSSQLLEEERSKIFAIRVLSCIVIRMLFRVLYTGELGDGRIAYKFQPERAVQATLIQAP